MIARALFVVAFIALCGCIDGRLQDLTPNAEKFIKDQEAIVREIAESMKKVHSSRQGLLGECKCSLHACGGRSPNGACFTHLERPEICRGLNPGRVMDNTTSMIRTPTGMTPETLTGSLKLTICIYKNLDEEFKEIRAEDEVGWMYIGTPDGHLRRYPATAGARDEQYKDEPFNGCNPFDPRIRPWYIAASTGPKDIVLVVDKSWSMANPIGSGRGNKWDVAKRAVSDILDTFSFTDFVNIVTFSDVAEPLWNETGLVRGDKHNLQFLRKSLDDIYPAGKTNFTAAFSTAFRLLAENCTDELLTCFNCQKIILFLTDGSDTSEQNDESIKPSKMAKRISRLQRRLKKETDRTAAIFTYSMTADADDAIPRQIACANDGAWSFIGPNTNVLDALNSYTLYLANGRSSVSPVWTEPFEDFGGLGMVTTVALPVYANSADGIPGKFLGVAGHDVPLRELKIDGLTENQLLDAIVDRSGKCTTIRNTECGPQAFRSDQDRRALCPDVYPTHAGDGGVEDSAFCYELNQYYYKRISEEIPWRKARARCEEDGGELVSIRDPDELAFIANLASPDGSWIGLQSKESGMFIWLDSTLSNLPADSPYWGVGEPDAKGRSLSCGAIDSRGIVGNLRLSPCPEALSFICKYDTDNSCRSGLKTIPKKGYFKIPPSDRCSKRGETDLTPIADNLNFTDIVCDMSEPPEYADATCCSDDSETLDSTAVVVVISIGSAGLFFSVLCAIVFYFRDRMPWKCCHSARHNP